MARQYTSARGKLVDMEKLRQANEGNIALGNMGVNARGDELGPGGRIVRTREEVIKAYNRQNPNAVPDAHPVLQPDEPVYQSNPAPDYEIHKPPVMDPNIPAIPLEELYKEAAETTGDSITEEDMQHIQQMEALRLAEQARGIEEMRQKRQQQTLQEQEERLLKEKMEIKTLVDEGNRIAEKIHSKEPIVVEKTVFLDEISGKTYKTEAALKGAVTRREKKEDDSEIEKTTDDGTDKGFEWAGD